MSNHLQQQTNITLWISSIIIFYNSEILDIQLFDWPLSCTEDGADNIRNIMLVRESLKQVFFLNHVY